MNGANTRDGFYRILEWIMVLAWLNILWVIFTLLGFVIFGWAPATVSLLSMLRKIHKEKNLRLPKFKEFYHHYKANFMKANGVGLILIITIFVLGYGFMTLPYLPGLSFYVMFNFYVVMTSLFMVMSIFVFPTLTHYQATFINYFKYALLIGLSNLHYGLLCVISLALTYILFRAFPGLILFFPISVPCAILMFITLKAFNRIENKIVIAK